MTSDERDPLIGQVLLGKLDVVRQLGAGGMGSVYEVEHLITHHRRALKIIRPELVKRRTYMKRLIREAGVAGTLNTPYVVDTYDAGTLDDGSVYILMELLEGESLYDVIQRETELTVPRLIGIVSQICEGVGVAHRAGIIHRDLKPDNIFLLPGPGGQEQVKIMDFGISKFDDPDDQVSRLTSEGVVLGTPFYMSPEQARGRALDARSDVYAVGVMMYEALTGRLPFQDASIGALFIKIAGGEYLPLRHHRPDISEGLTAVIERAMHRKREARYASMEELRAHLLPFGAVEAKVRAQTLSDHPLSPRSTAAYEEGEGRAGSAPPPRQLPARHTKAGAGSVPPEPDAEALAALTARDHRDTESVSQETIDTDEAPASRPRRRVVPVLVAVALLALAVGVGVALRGDGEATELEASEREASEPTVAETETERDAPETEAAEPPERSQPVADTEGAGGDSPRAEPDEPAEEHSTESSAGSSAESSAESTSRMRRRETTPAERAGLELSPYGR